MSVTVIEPLDTGPTNAELGHRIETMMRMVENGFSTINMRLDRYVLAEVHQLHVSQTDRRLDTLEHDVKLRLDNIENDRKSGGRWVLNTVISVLALLASAAVGVLAIVVR